MAAGTVVARSTGFVRTAALASVLGLTTTADAYNAASSVPTMLLVLVTGGTLSAALVPVLASPESEEGRRRAAAAALVAVSVVAGLGSVLLAVAAPVVAEVLSAAAPDAEQAERTRQTTVFLLLLSPQVLLLGVLVATNGILTVRGRLALVGATPVLNNLLALAGVAAYAGATAGSTPPSTQALVLLGGSSTLALAVASGSQLLACRRQLPELRDLVRSADREVFRRLLAVGRWSLLYVAANQVGLFVVLIVAGRVTGVVSVYQWSFAIMQLPFAVLAVPVLSAALPRLTAARRDAERLASLGMAARTLLLLAVVPSAFALLLFGDVAAAVLLGGGRPEEVARLADGVRWFALALVPFTAFQFLTRLCYVVERNAWPALVNLAVNATLLLGAGVALSVSRDALLDALGAAYVSSYVVGTVALAALLRSSGVAVLRVRPGAWRTVALIAVAAVSGAIVRVVVDEVVGVALAAVVLAALTAALLWPWRRLRLGQMPGS